MSTSYHAKTVLVTHVPESVFITVHTYGLVHCTHDQPAGAKFCPSCGCKVDERTSSTSMEVLNPNVAPLLVLMEEDEEDCAPGWFVDSVRYGYVRFKGFREVCMTPGPKEGIYRLDYTLDEASDDAPGVAPTNPISCLQQGVEKFSTLLNMLGVQNADIRFGTVLTWG